MKKVAQAGKHRGKHLPVGLSWGVAAVVVACTLCGCRSRDQYKAEADKEVYEILNSKWQGGFGQMGNYQISDPNLNSADDLPETGELSLAEAVGMAISYSRAYQSDKETLYQSALRLTSERHKYARQWFGTIDADYVSTAGVDEIAVGAGTGVDQTHLFGNGMQLATGLALDWSRFLTGDPRTSLGSVLTATLTAPILGAGAGLAAKEQLIQAERDVVYDIRTFSRDRKTFVIGIINDYYSVLQQLDSVSTTEASYRSQFETTNQYRMEVEVGKRAPYDLGLSEQSLLDIENRLVISRQRYEQALDNFKISLALPMDVNMSLAQTEFAALEDIGVSLPTYTEEEAIEMALERRLDLANTLDALDDAGRKLELAAKGLGMQMDLTAGTTNAGIPSKPATQAARIEFHEATYVAGLSANLPLDRKLERNAYVLALISYNRQKRNMEEQIDRVKLEVRQSYRDLAQSAETHRIQQMGYELAVKNVEAQKLSLKYGRSTARDLTETENDRVNARIAVTGALVNHTITKLEFFRDIGVLQVKPDGMWEQVTQ